MTNAIDTSNIILASICVPTYNGERYLHECLQSACAQQGDDIEILVCDDCSSDSTLSIVKTYMQKDARIKMYVNEQNLGLVGNWNRCLELAHGEWIKFLFQDDYLQDKCVRKMLSLAKNDSQLIVCEREYVFEKEVSERTISLYNRVKRAYQIFSKRKAQYISIKKLCKTLRTYKTINFIGEPTSVLFKKNLVKEIGFFRSDIIQLCDYEYWMRIGTNHGMVYTAEKMVGFRVHNDSTSNKNNASKYFAAFFSDKIIFLNLLLFDPAYTNFRKNIPKIEYAFLKLNLLYTVQIANNYIKKKDSNSALVEQLNTLNEKFPFNMHVEKHPTLVWIYSLYRKLYDAYIYYRSRIYHLITFKKYIFTGNAD